MGMGVVGDIKTDTNDIAVQKTAWTLNGLEGGICALGEAHG